MQFSRTSILVSYLSAFSLALFAIGCSDSTFSGEENSNKEVEKRSELTGDEDAVGETDAADGGDDVETDTDADKELDERKDIDTLTDLGDVVACEKMTQISGWGQSGSNPANAQATCKGVAETTQYVFCSVESDFISDCVEYTDGATLPIPEAAKEATAELTATITAANHAQCLQIAAKANEALEATEDPVVGCFRLLKQ